MKQELKKLENLLHSWGNIFESNMVISARVVVQNMAFYADEWSREQFDPYLDILKQMKEYNFSNHVLQWAYHEAYMIIDGHFMSEDQEFN